MTTRDAEMQALVDALKQIANASSESDDKDWYAGPYGAPSSYVGSFNCGRTVSVDPYEATDMDQFGYERGVHAAAVIARAALRALEENQEVSDDDHP